MKEVFNEVIRTTLVEVGARFQDFVPNLLAALALLVLLGRPDAGASAPDGCRADGRYVMGTVLELRLCDNAPAAAYIHANLYPMETFKNKIVAKGKKVSFPIERGKPAFHEGLSDEAPGLSTTPARSVRSVGSTIDCPDL